MAGNNISFDDISTGISYENFPKDPAAREAIAIVNNKVDELKDTTVGKQAVINLENKVKQSGLDNDNFKTQVNQEITNVKAIVDGIDGGNTAKLEELEATVNGKAPRDLVDSLLGQIEGSVKQINGLEPDENGNVIIDLDTTGLATSEEVTQKTDAIANLVFTKAETSAVEIIADDVTDLTTQVGLKATKEEFTTKTNELSSRLVETVTDLEERAVSVANFPLIVPEKSDRLRFQRAFDYAKNSGVGTVKIPKNDYVFDGIPVVLYENTIIDSNGATISMLAGTYTIGIGFFTTRVDGTGSPKLSIDYDAAVPIKQNITIKGKLILNGNMENVTTTNATSTCNGFVAYRVKNLKVEDLVIKNLGGTVGGGYGLITAYCETVSIETVTIDRTDRQNICIWETLDAHINKVNLNNSYLRDCILVSTNTPISLQASYCTISNSKLKNDSATGTHVIRFSGVGSGVVENCEIESNNNLDGVYITDTFYKFVSIKNNKMKKCGYGLRVESNGDKYIVVDSNEFENCVNGVRHSATGGIAIYSKNKIKGSTIQPFYLNYADHQTVEYNEFDGGTQVFISPNVTSHIIGNKVRGMTDTSNAVVIGGDTTKEAIYSFNTVKGNAINKTRIYTNGKAYGNIGTIESTTVTVV